MKYVVNSADVQRGCTAALTTATFQIPGLFLVTAGSCCSPYKAHTAVYRVHTAGTQHHASSFDPPAHQSRSAAPNLKQKEKKACDLERSCSLSGSGRPEKPGLHAAFDTLRVGAC